MPSQGKVCVIGNGAVGKAAALAFAQAGLDVTLLAPPARQVAPDPASWDLRVYALNHTAHALLSSLRVWQAMDAARVAPVDVMDVNGDGEGAGQLVFDAWGARTDTLAWIAEDRNINQALDAALRFAPGLRIVNGSATALRQLPDRAVVELAGGETIEAELVVGADGAESWVRGQCDIGLDYRSYGQLAVVSNFECEKPHGGVASQWFTSAEGIVALLPLPGQRLSLVWSAPEMLAQQLLAMPVSQLAERVCAVSSQRYGHLRPVQPELARGFPLRLMRPHAIVAPRVALVGDAAHVVHPLAGHGMNLGFADVAALVRVVAGRESYRDAGDERVLARYARERKEDILLMQVATDGLERLFGSSLEPVRLLRNAGLSLVNRLPFLKRALISQALGKR
ncbi:UbiH/UbiF family hydroxylase [Noviherbaspirillum aridicola]|uniref:Ubiquinone biosynthesis hydroxylase UbiH n=1 Tax=Noviherbaspirillum aridicola TaxID=2849687 RepID=A0ABQ4Q8M4_9BURK|nr:UbiH/UbiF family hydroxylase [Noviherbaspirillum aridicola]GIZ53503.1 ubiquinone biosynthesis hydroxylase UbiH [Noviherbaspirillum aridicola]